MKIIVVDDHPLVLSALAQLMPSLGRPVTMLGAADRESTYALLAAHPDCALLLLDLALPGTKGLELLGTLRRDYPRLPIAVLSARGATSPRPRAASSSSMRCDACSTAGPAHGPSSHGRRPRSS